VQKAPFTDVRVRNAIDMAIDRQQFMETRRLGDKQYLMDTLDRPETPFYDAKNKVPKYDLAGAQKLIDQVVAEQGGKPIQFTVTTFSTSYIVSDAELLQAQLNKLKNVEMKIEVLAATEVIRKYNAGEQQAVIQGPRWNEPAIDMVNWFSSTSNFNYMRYSNPTVDSALKQLVTATDQKTREQLVHQVEQQVLKDAPVVWYLRFPSNGIIDQKTVKNFKAYYDQRYLLDDVWLKAKKG
jgi:peptide/nickel transport system substrate-binding protein